MRRLLVAILGVTFAFSGAHAGGMDLAGSMWACTRARDGSRFVIVFYPGGGVGGGEMEGGEVSPYVFDASRTRDGEWPGQWKQTGSRFTWEFPDQHMAVEGRISSVRAQSHGLVGTETALGLKSAVSCRIQRDPPKIGEGLVIPQDGHFMDPNSPEGELKVPAGISLQAPGGRR